MLGINDKQNNSGDRESPWKIAQFHNLEAS